MIIINIQGGLGNQLFQYALGRKLSLAPGAELLLDTTFYGPTGAGPEAAPGDERPYRLGYFNTVGRSATPEEIRKIQYPYGVFIQKIKNRFEYSILRRRHARFEPSVFKKKGDTYLDGLWQSEKYFKDIRPILLKDLSLRKPFSPQAMEIAARIQKEPRSISLHVRRGDFVKGGTYLGQIYNCNQEYYTQALAAVAKNAGAEISHVFVFSDNPEWVEKNLDIPHKKTFVSKTIPDYEQIMLMSLCQSHIIANSTFGWWGAWLNDTKGKIVVAPSVWNPGIDLPIDDILPPEWLRIGV